MAVNGKIVKQRIGSVKNTKKITNAMQMIAAVKMRKSVESAVSTRPYATMAGDMMERLGDSELKHRLTNKRPVKKELLIMISSNRGLCGSYNSSVLKEATKYVEANKDVKFSVLALGKKAAVFAKKMDIELLGLYEKFSDNPKYEDIFPISKDVIERFESKEFDKVTVIYTNYISGLSQVVASKQVLPMTRQNIDQMLEDLADNYDSKDEVKKQEIVHDYEFEPTRTTVLDFLLPVLVEIQLYQSVLESAASEHSSRMIAMKNATEAAGEMIDVLTLEYNKARQAAITQEVSEIVAGAAALE
jgi:F-type H+-transporting ATPase subunit gamma